MQPGSETGPKLVLDPAQGCGADPFSQPEDTLQGTVWPPFLSGGKQAQVSQKPALSKLSESPQKVHFPVSITGVSRLLGGFAVAEEPIPVHSLKEPQRGGPTTHL